jgi:hypothetical protein
MKERFEAFIVSLPSPALGLHVVGVHVPAPLHRRDDPPDIVGVVDHRVACGEGLRSDPVAEHIASSSVISSVSSVSITGRATLYSPAMPTCTATAMLSVCS